MSTPILASARITLAGAAPQSCAPAIQVDRNTIEDTDPLVQAPGGRSLSAAATSLAACISRTCPWTTAVATGSVVDISSQYAALTVIDVLASYPTAYMFCRLVGTFAAPVANDTLTMTVKGTAYVVTFDGTETTAALALAAIASQVETASGYSVIPFVSNLPSTGPFPAVLGLNLELSNPGPDTGTDMTVTFAYTGTGNVQLTSDLGYLTGVYPTIVTPSPNPPALVAYGASGSSGSGSGSSGSGSGSGSGSAPALTVFIYMPLDISASPSNVGDVPVGAGTAFILALGQPLPNEPTTAFLDVIGSGGAPGGTFSVPTALNVSELTYTSTSNDFTSIPGIYTMRLRVVQGQQSRTSPSVIFEVVG